MDNGGNAGGDDKQESQDGENNKINNTHPDKTDQDNAKADDQPSFDDLFEIHNNPPILHIRP